MIKARKRECRDGRAPRLYIVQCNPLFGVASTLRRPFVPRVPIRPTLLRESLAEATLY